MYFQVEQTICTENNKKKELIIMKEIRTKLFSCDNVSRNGMIIPKDVMEKAVSEFRENHQFGLLCHPETESPSIINSIGMVDVDYVKDGDVFGKVKLLDNDSGMVYQNILKSSKSIKDGSTIMKVSPVGYGERDDNGNITSMNITHFNINLIDMNESKIKNEEDHTAIVPSMEYLKNVTIKFKKLNESAVIPSYAHNGDVGMDLTAISLEYDVEKDLYIYHTGLALESEFGYGTFLFPRSSNCKTDAYLTNSVGIADSAIYRGEIQLRYKNRDKYKKSFKEWITGKIDVERALKSAPFLPGERVGQMVVFPYPKVTVEVVDELSTTERGTGGFGSTGK